MKNLLICIFFLSFANAANAKFTIFACEPEWGTLAREIVGSKAVVFVGSSAFQDASNVKITSDIKRKMRKADMVFCSGAGIDDKWLNQAISISKNSALLDAPEKILFANDYALIRPLGVTGKNMRTHLNPNNILPIMAEFTRRISILDKGRDIYYAKSYTKFEKSWNKMTLIWQKMILPIKGQKVAIYGSYFKGLTDWMGLEVTYEFNPKTISIKDRQLMNQLITHFKENPVDVIIVATHENTDFIAKLATKTKTKMVLLPFTAGGSGSAGNMRQVFISAINLLKSR